MKIIVYTLVVLFFANTLHAQEASRIMKLSAEKYADMKVYMDSGKVISSYYNLPHPHSTALLLKQLIRIKDRLTLNIIHWDQMISAS